MAKVKKEVIKVIPDETVIRKIYLLRDQKVMLDFDLALLYEVPTKRLNEQVKRNSKRFPDDFRFRLTLKEWNLIRSQNATASEKKLMRSQNATASQMKRNISQIPYAFTEQGVAMLSGVINSPKAIEMHIAIMRAFVEMRKLAHGNNKLAEQLKTIFDRLGEHDVQLSSIYDAIENLLDDKAEKKNWDERERIGFRK